LIIVSGIFIKFYFDFPANKDEHQNLTNISSVNVKNKVVYIRKTGWEDTQTYIKFKATQNEINLIVKSMKLKPVSAFTITSSFYWWRPEANEKGKYFENKGDSEWIYLYYHPKTSEAYYFSTTF